MYELNVKLDLEQNGTPSSQKRNKFIYLIRH